MLSAPLLSIIPSYNGVAPCFILSRHTTSITIQGVHEVLGSGHMDTVLSSPLFAFNTTHVTASIYEIAKRKSYWFVVRASNSFGQWGPYIIARPTAVALGVFLLHHLLTCSFFPSLFLSSPLPLFPPSPLPLPCYLPQNYFSS